MMVSMPSSGRIKLRRSADWMSPLMNWKEGEGAEREDGEKRLSEKH